MLSWALWFALIAFAGTFARLSASVLRDADRARDRGRKVTLADALDFELARDVDRDECRLDLEVLDL